MNWDRLRILIAFASADALSRLIFFVFRYCWHYRKATIVENLHIAFPEKSARELSGLTLDYYRHVSRLLTSPIILTAAGSRDPHRIVRFEQVGKLNAFHAEGRDAVLMASHSGNWEYLLSLPLFTPYRVVAVCAKIKNTYVQRKMALLRSLNGATLVYKEDFYRFVLSEKHSVPTLYVIIADQRPSGVANHSVEFFGQKTMVQTGADRISRHLKCPVLYADVVEGDSHRYTFRFETITQDASVEKPDVIIRQYYKLLEKTIRRHPHLWLWSHRRWKGSNRKSADSGE